MQEQVYNLLRIFLHDHKITNLVNYAIQVVNLNLLSDYLFTSQFQILLLSRPQCLLAARKR